MAADATRKIEAVLTAVDNTEAGFRSAGARVKSLNADTTSLGSAFKTLGSLFAIRQAYRFVKDGADAFTQSAEQQTRLAQLLVTSTGATKDQITALNDQASALEKIGVVSAGSITAAQAQLATFDLQSETIKKLTPSILDYAVAEKGASVSADEMKGLVNGLAQALNGNFESLTKTGFVMDDVTKKQIKNGTESERAAALVKVLDSTYKDFNKTARDNEAVKGMTQFKTTMTGVKEFIFAGFKPALELLINGFNQVGGAAIKSGAASAQSFGHSFNAVLAKGASIIDQFVIRPFKGKDPKGYDPVKAVSEDFKAINDQLDIQITEANETMAKLGKDPGNGGGGTGGGLSQAADDAKKAADRIKDAFRTMSKNVVASLRDQESAVNSLRSSLSDLDDQTEQSVNKSKSKYVEDVKRLARQSQEKIDQIDKQIQEEQEGRSAGFRTRIQKLEDEKLKEKTVIAKAGGEIGDLTSELQRDELDKLYENHEKEIIEIREQADRKKQEMQREIDARQGFSTELLAKVNSKGFLDEGSKQAANTFLGSIGESPGQQQIVFNFNGDVAGDEGIKNAITEALQILNRQAALRGIAGN